MKQLISGFAGGALAAALFSPFAAIAEQSFQSLVAPFEVRGKGQFDNAGPELFKVQDGKITLAAPLEVVNKDGATLLSIKETIHGPKLTLERFNDSSIELGGTADGLSAILKSGENSVALSVGNGGASIQMGKEGARTKLLADTQGNRLVIETGTQTVVDIGVRTGRNAAVRIARPDGQVVAQVGSNPANGGAGAVFVGNGANNAAFLVSKDDGSGVAGITVGGVEVATLGPSIDGTAGKLTITTGSGTPAFLAGVNSSGQGMACAIGNGRQKCLIPTGLP